MGIAMTLNKGRVPVKVWTHDVEHEALQQLINVSQLPIVHGQIRFELALDARLQNPPVARAREVPRRVLLRRPQAPAQRVESAL